MLNKSSRPDTDKQRQRAASRLVVLALCVAVAAAALAELRRWSSDRSEARSPARIETAAKGDVRLTKLADDLIPMPAGVPSAHASTLAALPGGALMAFWWAGSRESGPDVKVYSSRLEKGVWSATREVATRESLGQALGFGIRRIGNPVAWTDRNGKVHLYVTTTGLGGWAASRIVHLVSTDQGDNFGVLRVLPMSPMFNTSVLIRTTPVALVDGGWWLPAYFELGIKYPILMAFDDKGDPRWLTRIGTRTTTLQPALVATSGTEAHAWMRDAGNEHKVQHAISHDAGASWADQPPLEMGNHSSSVAAYRLTHGGMLMLNNHVRPGDSARNVLRLSHSNDAASWKQVLDVVQGNNDEEFSYPALQQIGDELHITYTSRRQAIGHQVYRISYESSQ
ncbi:exo-alpha-sialidase [Massilia sp. TWP1-3-3]|uniref:exo-alpha-sialidase n=1 Tax=Massilia sp. TWP1-3-3 TaxID=2804573 RepID=UPI003CEFAD59